MEENRYGINWIGLFIKVIVFVVVVLLAIWLISKITLKNKGLSFEENNQKFQDAAVEYFKKNLPEQNDNITVTLNQLITWNYLEELKNEDGKKCDVKNSKSKIEVVEDYYSIKTTLVCGSKSETNYIKLGNEKCTDCDIKVEGLKEIAKKEQNEEKNIEETNNVTENSKGSSSTNNQNITNNQNNNTNQTILYEYVKETTEYSDWYIGKVTGTNIENSKKKISFSNYCKKETYNYYTISYVMQKQSYKYTLELINLDNVSSLNLRSNSYFTSINDYRTYLDRKGYDLEMVGANKNSKVTIPSASTIKNSSLTSSNFVYSLSKPYKENNRYYIDVEVNVKNLNGITPYYLSGIKSNVYYVPIKFTISYVNENNCITDKTENSNNYSSYKIIDTWNENVDIYRYKLITTKYKYSNLTSLEGYTKTGKTKLAS